MSDAPGESLSRRISRRAGALRVFFLCALNADLGPWFQMLRTGRATVSSSGLKVLCAPGLNCYSCPSALTSCPLGALQFWLNSSAEKHSLGEKISLSGLYILGTILALGAAGGRIFCGFVCPFGTVQEWISRVSGARNRSLPRWMRFPKYAVLFAAVIALPLVLVDGISLGPVFCKWLCPSGTLFAGLPLLAFDQNLRSAVAAIFFVKLSVLLAVIAMLFVTRRFFCKVLCPLGALWGLCNRWSLFRLSIDTSRCTRCKRCERACPMQVPVLSDCNSPECVRCLECAKTCPEDAITFSIKENK